MAFIQRNFGVLLLLSCLVGMFMPQPGSITPVIVQLALAFILFCSFFQINFTASTFVADFRISATFWLLRFVVIPVVLFYLFTWISDFYALILLLSFVLPSAVSSPSFTAIFGGKPDLSMKILVYSSFLAVITVPFLISILAGSSVKINQGKMLMTLIYTIIVPFIVHLPLRKLTKVRGVITRYNALFTLAGLSTIFIIVTARNKPEILDNIFRVGLYSLISLVIYSFMYILGYYLLPNQTNANRRTFAISSGANNIGLGVTITALFFPGDINIFFIISQLMWVVMLVPLRRIFTKT
jgi:predicted Na+-dependent transporter